MQTILFAILLASIFLNVASQCVFTPILSGVTPLQSLGEGVKIQISNAVDCKQLCASQTAFNCTAFLWPAEGGDCYLYDTINLSGDIFRDPMDSYVLYVQVCNGTTPSVGFCEFILNQTGVTGTITNAISPGIASEASCRQFCIACYQGPVCNAYVVSADNNVLSQCLLYTQAPTGLSSGTVNLYIKTCSPPPLSCQYTSWSTFGSCTQNCIKNRQRQVLSQPTVGGAPCLDSELVDKQSCTDSPCVLTTPDVTTVSATTAGSGTSQQCGASDYTSWTFWSTCDSTCQQYSNRSRSSTTCVSNGDVLQLSQVCQGGNCQSSTTKAQNHVPVVGATFTLETGCRIQSIDPQTRPSSKGFKAVGSQQSCSSRCAAETSFQCKAYSTTGPGGPCILHGAIDRVTLVTIMSNWYLQDINCVVNSSAATSLCGWQMVRNAIGPLDTTASQWKSLGYAINADHCGTLCMMNHPMYSPTTCAAYAYSGAVSWLGSQNNCYMYTTIDNPWGFNSTGSYNLYKLVCIANSTSVASATQS